MYLLISLLILAFIGSFWMGFKRLVQIRHLTRERLINGFLLAMILLTLISAGNWLDLVSEELAAQFTMILYTLVAGFFCGFAGKMTLLRNNLQSIEYVYRSFWTDAAPNLISLLIIVFGIYRTGLLTFGPYTGIGITSGLSLIGFGLFGLVIRIVPEFRRNGILILDQVVPWEKVVAYRWKSENGLQIDYYNLSNELTDFTTYIPGKDRPVTERLLGKKLKEYERERKKTINVQDE